MSSKRRPFMDFLRFGNRKKSDRAKPMNMVDGEEFHSHTDQLSQLLVVLDEQGHYHVKAGLRFEASRVFSLLHYSDLSLFSNPE